MKNLLKSWDALGPRAAVLRLGINLRQAKGSLPLRNTPRAYAGPRFSPLSTLAAGALLALFIATGCVGEATPAKKAIKDGSADTDRIMMSRSGLVRRMSIEDLAKEASIVVVGTIREVSAGRWSTPDGRRPTGPLRGGPDMPIIFREAVLEADEYVKGAAGAKELTIHLFGGQVGGDNMEGEDEVSLEPREKVLVFLGPTADPVLRGRAGYRVVGSIQGKYKITDGVAVGARPSDTVPIQDLIGRIRSAIAN